MNKSGVTIITPVYNMGKYLESCIESILKQTYTDFVLLLINDGSTDNSGVICDEYAKRDSRIKVIHTPNRGQDAARNIALEHVETGLLTMIDADDCVNFRFLESLVNIMIETDSDIVIPGYSPFLNDDEINCEKSMDWRKASVKNYNRRDAVEILCRSPRGSFVMPQKLYKTEVFNGVKYPPVGVNIDEWTIHHLLMNSKKITEVDSPLYYYRLSPEGMTRNFSLKKISGVKAWIDRAKCLQNNGYDDLLQPCYRKVYELALKFHENAKLGGLDDKKLMRDLKPELLTAFKCGILPDKDRFSNVGLFTAWLFAFNTTIYDKWDIVVRKRKK